MNGANVFQADGTDDDLVESWFEQGELGAIPEGTTYEPVSDRRPRFGMVIAALSATAVTLVIVFAGHV